MVLRKYRPILVTAAFGARGCSFASDLLSPSLTGEDPATNSNSRQQAASGTGSRPSRHRPPAARAPVLTAQQPPVPGGHECSGASRCIGFGDICRPEGCRIAGRAETASTGCLAKQPLAAGCTQQDRLGFAALSQRGQHHQCAASRLERRPAIPFWLSSSTKPLADLEKISDRHFADE